jgi:rhodanese-related sulfurtransferase
MQTLEPEGLRQKMAEGAVILVDVRTDPEVARGIIEGALHIPLHLLPTRLDEIDRNRPVVLYCQSGARSAQAAHFLAGNGWTEVFNLVGGIGAWRQRNLPVVEPR